MEMDEVANSYEIVVDRIGHMDSLEVLIEITDGKLLLDYGELESLREKIRARLRQVLQLDVKVKLVEPMSLKRFEGKAKRVRDLRKKD